MVEATTNGQGKAALLKPVHVFDLTQLSDSRSQKLGSLLHRNHHELATLRDPNLIFHTHMPHILGSSYYLGASNEKLQELYDAEASGLQKIDSFSVQDGLSEDNWRNFLNKKEYCVAYTKYFDSQVTKNRGDWKKVVADHLYSSPEPIVNGMYGGLAHPFIHLAYAYEYNSKEVATEALSLACTEYDQIHKFLDHSPPGTSTHKTTSFTEILLKIRQDTRFDGLFAVPGYVNTFTILGTREAALLEHWNALAFSDTPTQFEDLYHTAVVLAISTADITTGYDFFLAHVLTGAHAIRVLLAYLPQERRLPVFRQWWLWALLIYTAQLRLPCSEEVIESVDLKGRDWAWVEERGTTDKWSNDSHYVKVIRSLRVAAETWSRNDPFYLKAAVKYVDEFDGWTGFGRGV